MAELPPMSGECFFVAPIGEDGSEVRKRSDGVLNFIVAKAASELGLTAIRADNIAKPGQITLQVIQHVVEAKAVVADLTGLNPNVFYELALRHAAAKPLVLIAETGTPLPFDLAQMRTIFFNSADLGSADQCRASIVDHLKESLSDPSSDSPVSTVFQLQNLQQGNNVEQGLAEIITTVEELSTGMRQVQRYIEYDLERNSLEMFEARRLTEGLRLVTTRLAAQDPSDKDSHTELMRQIELLSAQVDVLTSRGMRRRVRPDPRPDIGIEDPLGLLASEKTRATHRGAPRPAGKRLT